MEKRDPDHARFEVMHRRAARMLSWLRKLLHESRRPGLGSPRGLRGVLTLFLMLVTASFLLLWVGDKISASGVAVTRFVARGQAPLSGEWYGSAHREDIVVLQYDQEFLDANNTPWPITYGEHAQWLLRLGELPERSRPRAVFLDISFGQERKDGSISQLGTALCALKSAGVPVFIAALASSRTDGPALQVRSGLRTASPPRPADDCFTLVGVSYTPDPVDRMAWSYPLSMHRVGNAWEEGPATVQGLAVYRSAAMTLAQDVGGVDLGEETVPMALVWGSRPPPASAEFRPPSYCDADPPRYMRYVPGLVRSFWADGPARPICPYHRAFSMARVGEFDQETLASQVAQRYVMIGADVPGYNDLIDSPVHGLVPGVHLHAMALDNLLTFGRRYKQTTEWGMPPAPSLLLSGGVAVLAVLSIHLLWAGVGRRILGRLPALNTIKDDSASAGASRDVRTFVVRVADGLTLIFMWLARLTLQTVVAIVLIALLQRWFRIGMLPVSELVAMTLAAEALDHVEKIRTFLIGPATK